MRLLRHIGAAGAVVAALFAIHRLSYVPLRSDIGQRAVESATLKAVTRPGPFTRVDARETLKRIESLLQQTPRDLDLHMMRAANLRLLGRSGEAADVLRAALRIEQRPEIYYQLGMSLLETGREQEAIAAFTRACEFQPILLGDVPQVVRPAVTKALP